MSDLIYPKFWWALGGLWLIFIVYVSVADLSLPQVDSSFGDKINHLLAYGFLMGWFGQLIKKSRMWLLAAMGFMTLGMLMEIIQGTLPHRWFDLKDALANTLVVLIALVVLHCGGHRILQRIETVIPPSKR